MKWNELKLFADPFIVVTLSDKLNELKYFVETRQKYEDTLLFALDLNIIIETIQFSFEN